MAAIDPNYKQRSRSKSPPLKTRSRSRSRSSERANRILAGEKDQNEVNAAQKEKDQNEGNAAQKEKDQTNVNNQKPKLSIKNQLKLYKKQKRKFESGEDFPKIGYVCDKEDKNPFKNMIDLVKKIKKYKGYFATQTVIKNIPFVLLNNKPLPTDVKELLTYAKESSFGDLKNGQNTINHNVRYAYEIMDNLTLTSFAKIILQEVVNEIQQKIIGKLNENKDQQYYVVLSKLSIYPIGGHFQKHQDTPRAGNVASIVVELPYDHTGGDLILEHDGYLVNNKQETNSITITGFLSNVLHQVTPVTLGSRVTLSFYVMSGMKEEKETKRCKKCEDDSLVYCVRNMLHVDEKSWLYHNHNKDIKTNITDYENIVMECTKIFSQHAPSYAKEFEEKIRKGVYLNDLISSVIFEDTFEYFPDDSPVVPDQAMQFYSNEFKNLLVKTDNDENDMKKGIGIFLSWKYSIYEFKVNAVKGSDRILLSVVQNAIKGSNFKIALVPVWVHQHSITRYEDSNEKVINIVKLLQCDDNVQQDIAKWDFPFIGNSFKRKKIVSRKKSESAWTGNEAEDGYVKNIYVACALVIYSI